MVLDVVHYVGELTVDTELELLNMTLALNFRLPTVEQLAQTKWNELQQRTDAASENDGRIPLQSCPVI